MFERNIKFQTLANKLKLCSDKELIENLDMLGMACELKVNLSLDRIDLIDTILAIYYKESKFLKENSLIEEPIGFSFKSYMSTPFAEDNSLFTMHRHAIDTFKTHKKVLKREVSRYLTETCETLPNVSARKDYMTKIITAIRKDYVFIEQYKEEKKIKFKEVISWDGKIPTFK